MDRGLPTFAYDCSEDKPVYSSHRLFTKSTEQSGRLDHAIEEYVDDGSEFAARTPDLTKHRFDLLFGRHMVPS